MVCKYSCTDKYIVSDNAGFCGMYSILKQPNLMVLAVLEDKLVRQAGFSTGRTEKAGWRRFQQLARGMTDCTMYGYFSGWYSGIFKQYSFCCLYRFAAPAGKQCRRYDQFLFRVSHQPFFCLISVFSAKNIPPIPM